MNKSDLVRNGSWGLVSHVSRTLLVSLFFIIIARHYTTEDFARYTIATVLAQMLSAFSALGLGQWFVREASIARDRDELVLKFLKTQILSGLAFYAVDVGLAFIIYSEISLRLLIIVVGANIVFDNIVNALTCLNSADLAQQKTFVIVTLDTALKCLSAVLLLFWPMSVIALAVLLVGVRVVTLNVFLKFGTSSRVDAWGLLVRHRGSFADVQRLVLSNWPWIVIGGVSIVNWRVANIIISKELGLGDTAIYEICYRVFAAAQMLPVIVSTAVFPVLVRLYDAADIEQFRSLYRQTYFWYLLFGFAACSFIYSFSDGLMPIAFGAKYAVASAPARQMFFTMLVFPTAFLQGNVLFAMKLERRDMWLNVVLFAINAALCIAGLHYVRSLTIVNGALLVSFAVFHLLQDVLLVRNGITSVRHVIASHGATIGFVLSYGLAAQVFKTPLVFPFYWAGLLLILLSTNRNAAPDLRPYLIKAGSLIGL